MSANESFPRPWRVERNPKNGLQNIVVAANGRLIAEPLPIDGATAEDCEAVAAEIAAVQRGGGNAAEPLSAILAEMCELAHGFANGEVCATARKVRQWVSRIEAAADRDRRTKCEQCIRDRVRDEEMKTRAEQMSPAEETDFTISEMRRAAENGRLAIKENPPVRSSLECYVDNTLAYANRLADSIARERRRAATKLSLAELHIKTLHK